MPSVGYSIPKQDGRKRAILDMHRRVGGSSGIVVKRPHSEESEREALKGHGHKQAVMKVAPFTHIGNVTITRVVTR